MDLPLHTVAQAATPAAPHEGVVPGFSAAQWGGVLAPGRTPKAVVTRINADIHKVMNLPEVREK